jgi:hypothetical protein
MFCLTQAFSDFAVHRFQRHASSDDKVKSLSPNQRLLIAVRSL